MRIWFVGKTNKSGKFSVLPVNAFNEKVDKAVGFLFLSFEGPLKSIRLFITQHWKECESLSVINRIMSANESSLYIKFLLKDRNVDFAMRVVVNEEGSLTEGIFWFYLRLS